MSEPVQAESPLKQWWLLGHLSWLFPTQVSASSGLGSGPAFWNPQEDRCRRWGVIAAGAGSAAFIWLFCHRGIYSGLTHSLLGRRCCSSFGTFACCQVKHPRSWRGW